MARENRFTAFTGHKAIRGILGLFTVLGFMPLAGLVGAEVMQDVQLQAPLDNPFVSQPHVKNLPDWNKNHYVWNESNDGLVRVIVGIDDSQFKSLKPQLQKTLVQHKSHVFNQGFSGLSTQLSVGTISELLRDYPTIQIQPDAEVHATVAVNQTGADAMWNRSDPSGNPLKGDGMVVAVIDTGIDYNHPALGGGFGPTYRVIGGWDYVNSDSNPMDDHGHGTHCAGIIGANGTIYGMAPNVKFLAYKVLNSGGSGYMSDTTAAIERAADPNNDGDTSDHADVISLSLGGVGTPSDAVCLEANLAMSLGTVVVVASGNDGPVYGTVASPGLASDVVTVGSINSAGALSTFTSAGTVPYTFVKPEICAPGENIYSTYLYSGYATMSGTSMATPHVSGAAALIVQSHPDWNAYMVKSALITGVHVFNETVWKYGSGGLWVPGSSDSEVFADPAILSYGTAFGTGMNITISNNRTDTTNFTVTVEEWHSMTYTYARNGTPTYHTNISLTTPSPNYVNLAHNTSANITLTVSIPSDPLLEGYYSGYVHLSNDSYNVSIPFCYVYMSIVDVRIRDYMGGEVWDQASYMAVYGTPDNTIVRTKGSDYSYIQTHLPSGTFVVHAVGRTLFYTYQCPFILTKTIIVSKLTNSVEYISYNDAKEYAFNLTTADDRPIFVKQICVYWRHSGIVNMSQDATGTDLTTLGSSYFNLPKLTSRVVVSPTNDTVGIAIWGYAYSQAMYDFYSLNGNHWYEDVTGTSTAWHIADNADEQYLLSWEFGGVNDTAKEELNINWSRASAFTNKYDIPANITNPWGNFGTERMAGGLSPFFQRRDTQSYIEPFLSGLNRTTTVQGPFNENYYTMYLFDGAAKPQYYVSDWEHPNNVAGMGNYEVADRNFLQDYPQGNKSQRVGMGPLFVSGFTVNTNSTMVLYMMPLFRDYEALYWAGYSTPMMDLKKNGLSMGTYSISGTTVTGIGLDIRKSITLDGSGYYQGRIADGKPAKGMSTACSIEWGFRVPGTDRDPPEIRDFDFVRKFTPGDSIPISVKARDASAFTSTIFWRNGSGDSWNAVALTPFGDGWSNGTLVTLATTATIDLMVNVSDGTNYLNYTMLNVARNEVPVSFNLGVIASDIPFTNSDQYVTIYGNLTCGGSALHATAAVPLDLYVGTEKVATILDSYTPTGTNVHNGSIRFEWHFNPIDVFSAANETVNVTCHFDLGTYEGKWSNFSLTSIWTANIPPMLVLKSPANNSIVKDSTIIDFDITDEDLVSVNYTLDGLGSPMDLIYPYMISTSSWSDGSHTVRVNATDTNTTASYSYTWTIDADAPSLSITWPANGTSIPNDSTITISVSDSHTPRIYWQVDGGYWSLDNVPYGLSTSSMPIGEHNITCYAYDDYQHLSVDAVNFNITGTAPLLTNSPSLTSLAGSEYSYNASCTAADSGVNSWTLLTNATFLNLNWSDQVNCLVNGTPMVGGSYYVNLSVADGDSSAYINYTLTVTVPDPVVPPSITTSPDIGVREDHLYYYDPNSDQAVTWALTSNATWLSMDGSGIMSGTPDNSVSEWDFWANVSCSNVNGSAFQNYSIHIWNVAPAFTPDLGVPPTVVVFGRPLVYDANHSDEGVGTPPGDYVGVDTNYTGPYTFNTASGHLNLTPNAVGSYWWNITGDDGRGVENSTNYQNWTMEILQMAPYILSSPTASTTVWEPFYFNCSATQADLGINTWSFSSNATWVSFIWGNQTLYNVSGTPIVIGSYWLNFSISDTDSNHYLNFTLNVVAGPTPVFTSSPELTAYEDVLYFYQAVCDDPIDTWQLVFSNATWCVWDATNGTFTGTPDNTHPRNYYTLYISATNMNGTEWQNWWVAVENRVPVFSSSPVVGAVNDSAYSYNSTTDDELQGNTTYSVNSNATFAYNIHALSGEVTFTPNIICIIWVNITCDDGTGTANSTWYQNFTITISEYTPLITTTPTLIWTVWVFYWFNATSTMPDVGVNVWGFTSNASWLIEGNFAQTYKNISGFPDSIGTFWFNMTIADGDSSFYLNATITIIAGPAPTITSSPILFVTEDGFYFYLPTADQYVTWTLLWIDGTWLTFDPANGSIMGNPTNAHSELGFNIWLQAGNMNGTHVDMWQVFVYNNPPIFTTTPGDNTTAGGTFTYDPTTSDESVGVTVYTVTTNTTDWYTIDATTGQLTFTPTIPGVYWFNITFDDMSMVGNSTAWQNFTVTVISLPIIPPTNNPSSPGAISVSFEYVVIGNTVYFSDNSYGDASIFVWNFGDGKGSTSENPSHDYPGPGIYDVSLTVYGEDGKKYSLSTRVKVDIGPPISKGDSGWNIQLTDTIILKVSAVGLLITGMSMFASAMYFPRSPLLSRRGRYVIGALFMGISAYYVIFQGG